MTQEEHDDLLADAINGLLDDLQQDVIAEMWTPNGAYSDEDIAYNQALDWVLDRLKIYRKE